MPGLKFRILLDSDKNEEVFRDVLISDTSDFETFYHAIMKSFDFKGDQMASFYVSNEDWDKGHEISLLDMSYDDDSIDSPATVMKNAVIKDFSKGSLWNFETLLNRAIGKPKETKEIQNEKFEFVIVKGKTIL